MNAAQPNLEEWTTRLMEQLQNSPIPLTLKQLSKVLPKPKKGRSTAKKVQPEPQETPLSPEKQAEALLEAQLATAQVFRQPSGKKGECRYWGKDERHHLRQKVLELAAKPMKLETLAKNGAKELKADTTYVESLVRELIGEGQLHEHKAKKGPSLFGAKPPPPPLSLPVHAKKVSALVKSIQALMQAAGVSAEEVLVAVRAKLGGESTPQEATAATMLPMEEVANVPNNPQTLDLISSIMDIMKAVSVLSLKDLRAQMPQEARGRVFDETVLRLARDGRVILSRDFNSTYFSNEERSLYVQEGEFLFTSISIGGHDGSTSNQKPVY